MTEMDNRGWSEASTGEVALAARGGNHEAFAALYERHGGRVYGLCLHISGDQSRARDLTQDVFIRIWERLDSLRDPQTFRAWLRQVTMNIIRNELRSIRRRAARIVSHDDASSRATPVAGVDAESRLGFENAVAALAPRHRTVFVLHDVEGYSHGEIAVMTGLPAATVRVHLHRARMQLRAELLG